MRFSSTLEPIWGEIITGRTKIEFEFLAARILQGNLSRAFAKDPSNERLEKCASDLRELFAQNADLPSARKDLCKILGREH